MKTSVFFTLKYWRKHLKNAAAVLFSGMLLTAIILAAMATLREQLNRHIHECYDIAGGYDILLANSNDGLLERLAERESEYDCGAMYVLGKMGNTAFSFTYGRIDDPRGLAHIPLEEGRMPKRADELAVDRNVLDRLFWAGKCGDSITLDGSTYTVVGIIDGQYGKRRAGSELITDPADNNTLYSLASLAYEECESRGYAIPLIFVGESDVEPLYRIDMLGNFFENGVRTPEDVRFLSSVIDWKAQWYSAVDRSSIISYFFLSGRKNDDANFFLLIAGIGAAISVLSVYSVLRSVFNERKSRIGILRRIGMSKRALAGMYVFEGASFAVIQTVLGFLAGAAAYWGIFLFKVKVLGMSFYSGFTLDKLVTDNTREPFFWAGAASVTVTAAAYLINALTTNIRASSPKKREKPRSLFRCFCAIFRQSGVTAVQTLALVLVCFSVTAGYMYYTDDGKAHLDHLMYMPDTVEYYAGSFDMEGNGIAEYYSCAAPMFLGLGHMDKMEQALVMAPGDYTKGIGDEVLEQFPEYVTATGYLQHPFIISDEPVPNYKNEIDLSNEAVRDALIELSDEKFQDFFEKGKLGSKYKYRAKTKLSGANTIERLSEYVVDGDIDLEKLNRGEDILVVYKIAKPPFATGERVLFGSAEYNDSGYGLSDIATKEVGIGAVIRLPSDLGEIDAYAVWDNEEYCFLTTASGASAIGFQGARYTEVFSSEEINGGLFPASAEMRLKSLAKMRRENSLKIAAQYSGIILILIVMSLLGFAAYFNGIGMKIRLKSYEISVLRAIGAPIAELKKRLLVMSLKIPLIAAALSYLSVKLLQFGMSRAYLRITEIHEEVNKIPITLGAANPERDRLLEQVSDIRNSWFLGRIMWKVNAEIPTLILLAVLCAVTFILTIFALKKFKGDIAGDLGEGRTRQ